ncbi:WD40 repeat domain-containing protein [Lusitaniella coriacea]|uniref:WD40 repeat domain-containing protein n=1 Tax=Lusitaniella coriacea TaxID=1983105 RepID=UPI003CF2F10A
MFSKNFKQLLSGTFKMGLLSLCAVLIVQITACQAPQPSENSPTPNLPFVPVYREKIYLEGYQDWIRLSFSPNSRYLATASGKGIVRLWQIPTELPYHHQKKAYTGKPLAVLQGHNNQVSVVNFDPSSQYLVTSDWDGFVRLWNISGDLQWASREYRDRINSADFSPNEKVILSASYSKGIRLTDWSGKPLATLQDEDKIFQAVFSPDGQIIAAASRDGAARLWNLSGELLATLEGHSAPVNRVRFSPDGKFILTSSSDGTARLWSVAGQFLVAIPAAKGRDHDAQFSPDGQSILTISGDGHRVSLWSLSGKNLMELPTQENLITEIGFSPDGKKVVTATDNGIVILWDRAGQQVSVFSGHQSYISEIAFSPNGQYLATASHDGTIRLWDLSDIPTRQ